MDVNAIMASVCRTQATASSFSFRAQVESSPAASQQQDTLELSNEGRLLSQGLVGKINALEQSSALASKPMFLKGVLQKLTGVKMGDVDIESLQITRSSSSLDATQVTSQVQPSSESLTYQHLSAQARQASLSVQGTAESKRGAEMGFSVQLDVSRLVARYTGYSWSATQSAPGVIDAAA